jgi:hypothetical protein
VFRLRQTVPDCPGWLAQVGGSRFDSAGRGQMDLTRMAYKRPGVRVLLAPSQFKVHNSNAKPVTITPH